MIKIKSILLIFSFNIFFFNSILSQSIIHQESLDFDQDGAIETFLFYAQNKNEDGVNQFEKFCIVDNQDTICIESDEGWSQQKELYHKAELNIGNWIGLIYDNEKTYLWLTGPQYGSGVNVTSFLVWDDHTLQKIFEEEFEVKEVNIIQNKKYLVGYDSYVEVWGDLESNVYFSNFVPTQYRIIGEQLILDLPLTRKKNLEDKLYIDSVDIQEAILVHYKMIGKSIMVDGSISSQFYEHDNGFLYLIKFQKTFFLQFSKEELRLMRNEVYAWYGYSFKSKDLKYYFEQQEWYQGKNRSSEFITKQLTEIEKHNIELILEIEKSYSK